jgi:hypothetical protein
MPSVYMTKALDVVLLFVQQQEAINISLSAVGLLWNATDLLGRSRVAAAAAAAAAASAATAAAAAAEPPGQQQPLQHSGSGVSSTLGGLFSVLSLSRRPTVDESAKPAAAAAQGSQSSGVTQGSPAAGKPAAAAAGSPLASKGSGTAAAGDGEGRDEAADPHLAGRSDLSEAECTELLIRIFEHLRTIGMEKRPEVSTASCQTCSLKHAVGLLCAPVICPACVFPCAVF